MLNATEIARIAAEYNELKRKRQSLGSADQDIPDEILERESLLVRRLIATSASSGQELAHKAHVLLDWVVADDLSALLTRSLCQDAIGMFLGKRDEVPRAAIPKKTRQGGPSSS